MKTNYYSQIMEIRTVLKSSIGIFKTAYIKTGAIALLFFIMMSGQKMQAQYSYDFGDAPDSYHTLLANNGAYTGLNQNLHIGATFDAEADGQTSVNADGDGADDDGLAVIPPLTTNMTTYSLDVTVYNNIPYNPLPLWGWIDFNRDGTFDCNEYAEVNVPETGLQTVTLTWSGLSGLVAGQSYIRLRIEHYDDNEPNCSNAFMGSRANGSGEIEDYTVTILPSNKDFGDAPDSYNTLFANNGAYTELNQNLHIGATVDADTDGQPSINADGDGADDDGLAVIPPLTTNMTTYSLDVTVYNNIPYNPLPLWGWIDFNRDGTFDCNEFAEVNVPETGLQTVTLTWSGLSGLVAGQSYIRLRIEHYDDNEPNCSNAFMGSRANGSGEIEDYTVTIQKVYDFGDAPDSYNTLMANNGAYAELNPDLHIGATVDGEVDGQPSVNADGDGADEDGLAVIPPLTNDATTYSLDVSVYCNTYWGQTLWGWIDFNRDGTFDCNEYAEVSVPGQTNSLQTVTLTWSGITGLVTGQSYIRLRIENFDDVDPDCSNAFTGARAYSSGEIEDYTVTIICGQISAPTITTITQPSCSVITGGGSVVLGNLPSSGTWTLTREPGTVTTTGTGTSTTISGLAQGTYTFMVTNSFGCDSSVSANVVITDPTCNSGIFPTAVTCSSYKTGANSLSQLCYTSKSNKVSNVTPGQFFYYTTITAPSASFTIDVIETKSCSGLALFGINQKNQILLWDPNCSKYAQGTQVSLGNGRINITKATVGAQYVLAVKYDSKTIIGSTFTGSASTCTYTFVTKIDGVTVSGSTVSIDLVPNCKTTTGKLASTATKTAVDATPAAESRMDVEVFPVPFKDELFLRYKFETDSKVTIEIFDIEGRLLARESDTKVFFDKELKINNNFKTLSNKVYFIKISSDKGSVTKTVISK